MSTNEAINKPSGERSVYFITGSTGLMGSEFVYEVLNNSSNSECILLIRADTQIKIESRLDALMLYLFPDKELFIEMRKRVKAVRGDVGSKQLGMSDDDWEWVSKSTNYILHAAALTDWGANIKDATKVNVFGVKEVISLAYSCRPNLKKFIHISSAYVSGSRVGNISPNDINVIEHACDNYQISKIQGENLVRREWSKLPITIVRPGAVVGNSNSGRTPTYKTFYYPLQMLYNGLPLVLPVKKHGNTEAVPSDWAAKVMLQMMLDESTNGDCYHLTNGSQVLTNSEIKKIVYKAFNDLGENPKRSWYIPYVVYDLVASRLIKSRVPNGESLDEKVRLYRHYMTYRRLFDNTTTLEFTDKKDISLPGFRDYLHVLMDYAIQDKWYRKREVLTKRFNRSKSNQVV